MEEKILQEKLLTYRILEARLNGLLEQKKLLVSKLNEVQTTISSIKEAQKTKGQMLIPLGAEAYIAGEIKECEKLLVGIGANVAIEKTIDEGLKIMEKRKEELQRSLTELEKAIVETSFNLNQLAPEIRESLTKLTKK
jgi:prefoldin alpha subunit